MLMTIEDVAAYLNTSRNRAVLWLAEHNVPVALHMGRGKGGGPRYSPDDFIPAVEAAKPKQSEETVRRKPDVFDKLLRTSKSKKVDRMARAV